MAQEYFKSRDVSSRSYTLLEDCSFDLRSVPRTCEIPPSCTLVSIVKGALSANVSDVCAC